MQHTRNHPAFIAPSTEINPAFKVVIAYEDFETGKHAKRTYDFLVEHLGHDCQFVNQMWKFDVLSIPKLREIAAEDAARSDLIMIASSGNPLGKHVELWIEAWLAQAPNSLALVALFDPAPELNRQARTVRDYLSEVAQRGDMEFFAQPAEWPTQPPQALVPALGSESGLHHRTLSTLAGVMQRDASLPRWGINE